MNRNLHRTIPGLLLAALLLSGCAGPRANQTTDAQSDADFVRQSRLARAAYDRGSLTQAETLYGAALRRARSLDNAADMADAAYNLAAVLMARGQLAQAGPLLDEAAVAYRRAGQTPVDVWLVQAKLAVTEQQPATARHWIEAVEQTASASPAQRLQAGLLRGEIACDESNLVAANVQLALARKQMTSASPLLSAGVEKLSGRVALLENQPAAAAAAFDREADFCRRAGQPQSMARALVRAGEAFAAAGDTPAAAEHLYRAARSFLAQGDLSAAQSAIARAQTLAVKAGDAALTQRVENLAAEIKRTRPASQRTRP